VNITVHNQTKSGTTGSIEVRMRKMCQGPTHEVKAPEAGASTLTDFIVHIHVYVYVHGGQKASIRTVRDTPIQFCP
jgi:hypothetical protein